MRVYSREQSSTTSASLDRKGRKLQMTEAVDLGARGDKQYIIQENDSARSLAASVHSASIYFLSHLLSLNTTAKPSFCPHHRATSIFY